MKLLSEVEEYSDGLKVLPYLCVKIKAHKDRHQTVNWGMSHLHSVNYLTVFPVDTYAYIMWDIFTRYCRKCFGKKEEDADFGDSGSVLQEDG